MKNIYMPEMLLHRIMFFALNNGIPETPSRGLIKYHLLLNLCCIRVSPHIWKKHRLLL